MTVFENIFKFHITLANEMLFIHHRYTFGKENIPDETEKYFIVCNHQNCINDPLNIMFALPFHKMVGAMARDSIFHIHPLITGFFRWVGMIPAFRMGWEGAEGLENNFQSFDMVAESVNEHRAFMVFPEAGHTQGHYLDRFTTGTVRIAFHVAKCNNWQEDIKIVPAAHHYEDYFGVRTDFMLSFAKPISLMPYYERFQTHPNSVMREITLQLHDTIQSMMLDEGKEDYAEKEFLRSSSLNVATLKKMILPDRLQCDKQFIASLLENKDYPEIIQKTRALRIAEEQVGIDDITIHQSLTHQPIIYYALCIVHCALLLLLLPLWLIALIPHGFFYAGPPMLLKEDKMFTNTYRWAIGVLGLYPVAMLFFFIIGTLLGWWWQTLLWILLWIPLAQFAWWYYTRLRKFIKTIRWYFTPRSKKQAILQLRKELKDLLKRSETH